MLDFKYADWMLNFSNQSESLKISVALFNGKIYYLDRLQFAESEDLKLWLYFAAISVLKVKQRIFSPGREPWSSGYGWQLMLERSWVRIPAPYTG